MFHILWLWFFLRMPLKNAGCYTVFVRSLHSSFFLENPNRRTKGYNLFVFTRKKNQQRICIVIAQAITLPIFQCRKRSRVLRNCKSSTMVIKTFFEDDMFCYIIFVSAKKGCGCQQYGRSHLKMWCLTINHKSKGELFCTVRYKTACKLFFFNEIYTEMKWLTEDYRLRWFISSVLSFGTWNIPDLNTKFL